MTKGTVKKDPPQQPRKLENQSNFQWSSTLTKQTLLPNPKGLPKIQWEIHK